MMRHPRPMGIRRPLALAVTLSLGALLAAPAQAINLAEAYRLAVSSEPNFLASQAATAASREQVAQAMGNLLPSIGLNVSRFRSNTEQTYPTATGDRTTQTDYMSKNDSLTLRQPLLRLDRYYQYRQSEAQVASAEAQHDQQRQSVGLRVASAYFDTLVALERAKMTAAQKASFSGQLARAEKAFSSGYGTRTDIDEARARYDMSVAQEFDAANQVAQAERALAAVISQKVSANSLDAVDPALLPKDGTALGRIDDWLAKAEAANPELISARQLVEAAENDVARARSGHLPTLDLVAIKSRTQSDTTTSINQSSNTSQIGVQLSVPLFAGGQTNSAVRQAQANLERYRQQRDATQRQLSVLLGKELDAVTQGLLKMQAGEQALRSASLALQSTRKGVEAGTRNTIDVLNAQQLELEARFELVRSRYDFVLSWLKLHSYAGELNEAAINKASQWLRQGVKS